MKKIISLMSALVLTVSLLIGCGGKETTNDELVVYFVPSRDPEEIVSATEPLKNLLKTELANQGYEFNNINIQVGTNFEAVGEALAAGTADVGFIPGGTYVLYDDVAQVILTATRNGFNKESEDPKEWNGNPTEQVDKQVTYYRALLVSGPSERGMALAKKVNSGEKLSLDDLQAANWGTSSSTSPAGYIYPSLWLKDNYGISITDLKNVVQCDSYGSMMARLASGQIDVGLIFADARMDYADEWQGEYGRSNSIWDETAVIGVCDKIFNDTISVSKNSDIMNDDLIKALQNAFINIAKTDEGKKVIAIYSHNGYEIADDKNYDSEREAQELIQSMK